MLYANMHMHCICMYLQMAINTATHPGVGELTREWNECCIRKIALQVNPHRRVILVGVLCDVKMKLNAEWKARSAQRILMGSNTMGHIESERIGDLFWSF